jgi:hypothetical protein
MMHDSRPSKKSPMVLCGLTAAFFFFVGGIAFVSAAPQILVEQPVFDFGAITNGSEILHDFVIRNAGDADLEINRVISSCSVCLKAKLEKYKIPPGGASLLHTCLDLRSFSGPISRSITIESNDPNNAWLILGLAGVVTPSYQMTPLEIDLDLSQGQKKAVAEITPLLQLHAPLSQVHYDNTNILAKVSPAGTGRFVLSLEVLDSLPRGNAVVNLTLFSADSNDPPFHATGFIHNPPDLEVLPERLQFFPQVEPQMRILWLKQHGATPAILLDIIPPSDKFKCEIEADSTGYNYRIYVNAYQQEAMAGQTNVLLLKMRDHNGNEHAISVPITVEPAG